MKNQCFGDINDYRKYGLLRCLSGQGAMHTADCWMLTAGDGSGDGGHTRYLCSPSKWRAYGPPSSIPLPSAWPSPCACAAPDRPATGA
jgi:hypothetical protein